MSTPRPAAARDGYPARVVCLTEETTEILYRIGAEDLVVGVSGYTVRPPEARKKPKVSAFVSARYDKILELEPDVVLAFSDLQADITRELVKRGLSVFTFNQRSIEEILTTVRWVGAIVGYHEEAEKLAAELAGNVARARQESQARSHRPRVFFEEWPDPLISGIRWVSELVEAAGGRDIFPELLDKKAGGERIIEASAVVERDPEVIVASWCGRKVRPEQIAGRDGFDQISAVRAGRIHEIKSALILQPGPAALTEGLDALREVISAAARGAA